MTFPRTCPVCEQTAHGLYIAPAQLQRENQLRKRFVETRLGRPPVAPESMDLTSFMHGGPARLAHCRSCGSLLREEAQDADYAHDVYDSALLRHLYPRYLQAFREKQEFYRPLLRSGAEVVEVGSHLGCFLQAAEEWGWKPTGLDIGGATRSFARQQDLTVKGLSVEDYTPRLRRPEAVFIWNCFEQLPDPRTILRRCHQLLDRHGLLVLRVPNAGFYRAQRRILFRRNGGQALRLLGYNNLLGFPYLYGYTKRALYRLLETHHFEPLADHSSSLLTPPYPDLSARLEAEWSRARSMGDADANGGPWLEMVCRKAAL